MLSSLHWKEQYGTTVNTGSQSMTPFRSRRQREQQNSEPLQSAHVNNDRPTKHPHARRSPEDGTIQSNHNQHKQDIEHCLFHQRNDQKHSGAAGAYRLGNHAIRVITHCDFCDRIKPFSFLRGQSRAVLPGVQIYPSLQ